MISAVNNQNKYNKTAFGATELSAESKILKTTLTSKVPEIDEATFLKRLPNNAKHWIFDKMDKFAGADLYCFRRKNSKALGDTLELQPKRDNNSVLPAMTINNSDESLILCSHEKRKDSTHQQNLFDKAAEAFMELIPKK